MENEILYESQILKLDKFNFNKILNRKVKIYVRSEEINKSEFIGVITKINLATNEPHKPFDLTLENTEDFSSLTFGIIGITKIEFIE